MTAITSMFSFDNSDFRVITIDDEPWFVAKDVCSILLVGNVNDVVKYIPENWRSITKISTPGGTQNVSIISEAGLYRMIIRSSRPIAAPFQEWICGDLIPTIRKTGEYKLQQQTEKLLHQKDIELYHKEQELIRLNRYIKRSKSNFTPGNCVYIIANKLFPDNQFKIGQTENMNKRLGGYNTSSAADYEVIYIRHINEMINVEGLIMSILTPYRINRGREWFEVENIDLLIEEIDQLCEYVGQRKMHHVTISGRAPVLEPTNVPAAVLPNVQTKNPELLTIKPCSHCNTEKLLNEFNMAKEHRDGRENVCKKCKRIRQAKVLSEQRANTDFPNEKSCNLCNVTKPLNDFHNDKLAPDGHMRRCKDCHNEKQKKPKTLVVITEKCCASCKDIKPITDYYRHSRSKDGYAFYCRICSQIKGRANYAKAKGKTKGTTTEDSND
jgi:prophage antirepressor-like protein